MLSQVPRQWDSLGHHVTFVPMFSWAAFRHKPANGSAEAHEPPPSIVTALLLDITALRVWLLCLHKNHRANEYLFFHWKRTD
jgi:hypothetical protein